METSVVHQWSTSKYHFLSLSTASRLRCGLAHGLVGTAFLPLNLLSRIYSTVTILYRIVLISHNKFVFGDS